MLIKKSQWLSAILLLSLSGLLLPSCSKDPDTTPEPQTDTEQERVQTLKEYPGVDPELWPYFQLFEEASEKRGFPIDLVQQGITGSIDTLEGQHVAGLCNYSSALPGHVTISHSFWAIAPSLFKEMVIFHELGHCHLKRDHREGQYPDGTCKSIMRSGIEECEDNYTPLTRKTYLNELFAPYSVP